MALIDAVMHGIGNCHSDDRMMSAMASHSWSPASGRHLGSLLDLVVWLVLAMRRSDCFPEGSVRCNGRWP
jgi:hypothetical protein